MVPPPAGSAAKVFLSLRPVPPHSSQSVRGGMISNTQVLVRATVACIEFRLKLKAIFVFCNKASILHSER